MWFHVCLSRYSPNDSRPTTPKASLADVRSHGYYDADSQRIAGSVRLEPNNLEEEIKNLPHDREIYLYCT